MDISTTMGFTRFNYRVSALIYHNNKILVVKDQEEDFWFLPGGRVKVNENSVDALKRELTEELQCEFKIGELKVFNENFFDYEPTHESFHELGLYYEVNILDEEKLNHNFETQETMRTNNFNWLDLNEISNHDIRPAFLKKLTGYPEKMIHLVETK